MFNSLFLLPLYVNAAREHESSPSASSSLCDPADNSLFSFMSQTAADNSVSTRITAEVDSYLASHSTDSFTDSVSSHCSRKYNAVPSTSAAVERLFSTAGQTLTARRCKMTCFWDTNWKMTNGRLMFVLSYRQPQCDSGWWEQMSIILTLGLGDD